MNCLYCGEFMITVNEGGLGEFYICMTPGCPEFSSMPSGEINAYVDNVKENSQKHSRQEGDNDDQKAAS